MTCDFCESTLISQLSIIELHFDWDTSCITISLSLEPCLFAIASRIPYFKTSVVGLKLQVPKYWLHDQPITKDAVE